MSSFIEQVVQASARYGVPCVVLGGSVLDPDDYDDDLVPMASTPVTDAEQNQEIEQLRAQVQQLTAELQAATTHRTAAPAHPEGNGNGQVPAGDHGSVDDQSIDVLGLEDEKLARKMLRLGYDTVGKLRLALHDGKLAEQKIKKDWLIDIGMAVAGAAPSGGGATVAATAPVAVNGVASDVPAGHADRPWSERLGLARTKQKIISDLRESLDAKRAESEKFVRKNQEVPEELDEDILKLEDDIALVDAQVVAMRWCMGLDPSPNITLDEALRSANLGPWMERPTPRVSPEPVGA